MHLINYKIILAIVLYSLSIGTGIWLTRIGRPLNTIIFTFHKLAAVGFIVFLIMYFYTPVKTGEFSISINILLIICTAIILGIIITGALLSFEREFPGILLILHKVLPGVAVFTFVLMSYLIFKS